MAIPFGQEPIACETNLYTGLSACMTSTFDIDTIIIGAGAVGLACAAALARAGHEVLVTEGTGLIGSGISSRNSEVIHAGLYYPHMSLKHRLCVAGRRALYDYLQARGVAHRKCQKLIVATSDAEDAGIEQLSLRGTHNGVENLIHISGTEAMALEPCLSATSALWSQETGVFDSHGYMLALQGEIEDQGGVIAFNAPFEAGEVLPQGGFVCRFGGTEPLQLRCRILINSAGLQAHKVARHLSGYDMDLSPPFFLAKGSYFSCASKPVFQRLIYPAPVDGGLGVHVTLDLGGQMRFGPDVEWLDHNDPDAIDYEVDPRRSESFYAAVRRYWPGLPDGAIQPDYAGYRPKLSNRGEPAADFRIDGPSLHGHDGLVHLFGIESPGLTSSLAIADMVIARLAGQPDPY
jgi:L-2-hydroxyglutarate oxidase LhgO